MIVNRVTGSLAFSLTMCGAAPCRPYGEWASAFPPRPAHPLLFKGMSALCFGQEESIKTLRAKMLPLPTNSFSYIKFQKNQVLPPTERATSYFKGCRSEHI